MASISPVPTQAPVASAPLVASSRAPVSAPVQQAVAPQQTVTSQPQQEQPVSEHKIKSAVHQANQMLASAGSNETISFAYEAKLNQLYVTIVDQKSGAVVREIPSKDFIRHQIAMREMIGMILDKQA